jgi:dTDP-4-amino-4,6-dideoxygalactose transaminase
MYGIRDAREIWGRYNKPRASWDYDIKYLGYKCNMMDIVAALGIHQLKKLDCFIKRRNENRALYDASFKEMPEITIPYVAPYTKHCWHLYPLLLNLDRLKIDRNRFIQEIRERNVGASVMFRPLHMHSYYRDTYGYKEGDYPVAANVFSRMVNLPVSPAATSDDIQYVIDAIKNIVEQYRK